MRLLRAAAQRLTRGIVFERRLPARYGGRRLLVSSEGGLKYFRQRMGAVDPVLLEGARQVIRTGACVWDVGANLGLLSFAAAGLAGPSGQVVALEPDTFLVALLHRSAALPAPGCAPVDIIPLAVSDKVGLQRFAIASAARAANHLIGHGLSAAEGQREVQTVMSVTLDWLNQHVRPPDVIKIDVEGAEACVLRGALAVLSEHRPTLICEVSRDNREAVTALLTDAGYALFDMEAGNRPVPAACWATLAIHRDRGDASRR